MLYRKWSIKDIQQNKVQQLSNELNVESILSKVLLSKGVQTSQQAQEKYLQDTPLSDPFLLKDMDKAVDRIHKAIYNDEKIVVYGDYDVDGVTATAVLFLYLESQGANVFYKLPNRETEGYGLNSTVLENLKNKGVDLVITVDNGITAIEQIDFANSIGLDVVVTDHHLPKKELPNAIAVVDPLREDDESPCKILAGVGVAFKLICALEGADCDELLDYFADLVAVGTIADLMLLEGENRTITKYGINMLNEQPRQCFTSMIETNGYKIKEITAETIAFTVAPRINAAGRMGDATMALELLLEEDKEIADEMAIELEKENQKRQETQKKMADDIASEISKDKSIMDDRILVVWDDDFHPGVVGIVASRLVESYGRPAIVLTKDGDEYKGSGRSIPSFSLHKGLEKTKEYLIGFGGHELAAGVRITAENLENFKRAINEIAKDTKAMASTQSLEIDCVLDINEVDVNSIQQVDFLAPFGNGNEIPLFAFFDLEIAGLFQVSDGKHTRLKFKKGNDFIQGLYFNKTIAEIPYKIGDKVDVALMLSIYNNDDRQMISAKIKEIRPTGINDDMIDNYDIYKLFKNKLELSNSEKLEITPTRDEFALVYRYIMKNKVNCDDLRPLFMKFSSIQTGKIQIIIDVLLEFNLIKNKLTSNENYFEIIPTSSKFDLNNSGILKELM